MRLSSPDSSCMFAAVCRIDSRIPSDHDLLQRSWRICTKVPRHPKGAVAIKERWLDTPFASISTHLFGASGTVHPLEANDVWYILDYIGI